jgi:hypothetical protein
MLDPLDRKGATGAVREWKDRLWPGIEVASTDAIIERLAGGEVHGRRTLDRVDD